MEDGVFHTTLPYILRVHSQSGQVELRVVDLAACLCSCPNHDDLCSHRFSALVAAPQYLPRAALVVRARALVHSRMLPEAAVDLLAGELVKTCMKVVAPDTRPEHMAAQAVRHAVAAVYALLLQEEVQGLQGGDARQLWWHLSAGEGLPRDPCVSDDDAEAEPARCEEVLAWVRARGAEMQRAVAAEETAAELAGGLQDVLERVVRAEKDACACFGVESFSDLGVGSLAAMLLEHSSWPGTPLPATSVPSSSRPAAAAETTSPSSQGLSQEQQRWEEVLIAEASAVQAAPPRAAWALGSTEGGCLRGVQRLAELERRTRDHAPGSMSLLGCATSGWASPSALEALERVLTSAPEALEVGDAQRPARLARGRLCSFLAQAMDAMGASMPAPAAESSLAAAACRQFGARDFPELGHGPLKALLQEMQGGGLSGRAASGAGAADVQYSEALLMEKETGGGMGSNDRSGWGGDSAAAKGAAEWAVCETPDLHDVARSVRWRDVFEEELGPIERFAAKRHSARHAGGEEGRSRTETDAVVAMLQLPVGAKGGGLVGGSEGALVRVTPITSIERFLASLHLGDGPAAARALVGLVVGSGGAEHAPLRLLRHHQEAVDALLRLTPQQMALYLLGALTVMPSSFIRSASVLRALLPDGTFGPGVQHSEVVRLAVSTATGAEELGVLLQAGLTLQAPDLVAAARAGYANRAASAAQRSLATLCSEERASRVLSGAPGGSPPAVEVTPSDAMRAQSRETSALAPPAAGAEVPNEHTSPVCDELGRTANLGDGVEIVMGCGKELGGHDAVGDNAVSTAEAQRVVESIRREEYGIGLEATSTWAAVQQRQHARLQRALARLTQEIYAEEAHVMFELLQNADDNRYPNGQVAALAITIGAGGMALGNNELGFSSADIRALCDVARSSKAAPAGQGSTPHQPRIGEKGIGFKAVFALSDRPHIASGAFRIAFDAADPSGLGLVLPRWTEFPALPPACALPPAPPGAAWRTRMWLPVRAEVGAAVATQRRWPDLVPKLVGTLQPAVLLFLNRLDRVEVRDEMRGEAMMLLRTRQPHGQMELVEVAVKRSPVGPGGPRSPATHSPASPGERSKLRWLVLAHAVPTAGLSKRGGSSSGTSRTPGSTTIRVALRLGEGLQLENAAGLPSARGGAMGFVAGRGRDQVLPELVYAYLPLRSFGLRFALHADWAVPSSREDISAGSAWNELLRDQLPAAFLALVDSVNRLADLHLCQAWLAAVPLPEDRLLGFLHPTGAAIRAALRHHPCLPSAEGSARGRLLAPQHGLTASRRMQAAFPAQFLPPAAGTYVATGVTSGGGAVRRALRALGVRPLTAEHASRAWRRMAEEGELARRGAVAGMQGLAQLQLAWLQAHGWRVKQSMAGSMATGAKGEAAATDGMHDGEDRDDGEDMDAGEEDDEEDDADVDGSARAAHELVFELLVDAPVVFLRGGRLGKPRDGIFLPAGGGAVASGAQAEADAGDLCGLEAELRVVDEEALSQIQPQERQLAIQALEQLGVRAISPLAVLRGFVVPRYQRLTATASAAAETEPGCQAPTRLRGVEAGSASVDSVMVKTDMMTEAGGIAGADDVIRVMKVEERLVSCTSFALRHWPQMCSLRGPDCQPGAQLWMELEGGHAVRPQLEGVHLLGAFAEAESEGVAAARLLQEAGVDLVVPHAGHLRHASPAAWRAFLRDLRDEAQLAEPGRGEAAVCGFPFVRVRRVQVRAATSPRSRAGEGCSTKATWSGAAPGLTGKGEAVSQVHVGTAEPADLCDRTREEEARGEEAGGCDYESPELKAVVKRLGRRLVEERHLPRCTSSTQGLPRARAAADLEMVVRLMDMHWDRDYAPHATSTRQRMEGATPNTARSAETPSELQSQGAPRGADAGSGASALVWTSPSTFLQSLRTLPWIPVAGLVAGGAKSEDQVQEQQEQEEEGKDIPVVVALPPEQACVRTPEMMAVLGECALYCTVPVRSLGLARAIGMSLEPSADLLLHYLNLWGSPVTAADRGDAIPVVAPPGPSLARLSEVYRHLQALCTADFEVGERVRAAFRSGAAGIGVPIQQAERPETDATWRLRFLQAKEVTWEVLPTEGTREEVGSVGSSAGSAGDDGRCLPGWRGALSLEELAPHYPLALRAFFVGFAGVSARPQFAMIEELLTAAVAAGAPRRALQLLAAVGALQHTFRPSDRTQGETADEGAGLCEEEGEGIKWLGRLRQMKVLPVCGTEVSWAAAVDPGTLVVDDALVTTDSMMSSEAAAGMDQPWPAVAQSIAVQGAACAVRVVGLLDGGQPLGWGQGEAAALGGLLAKLGVLKVSEVSSCELAVDECHAEDDLVDDATLCAQLGALLPYAQRWLAWNQTRHSGGGRAACPPRFWAGEVLGYCPIGQLRVARVRHLQACYVLAGIRSRAMPVPALLHCGHILVDDAMNIELTDSGTATSLHRAFFVQVARAVDGGALHGESGEDNANTDDDRLSSPSPYLCNMDGEHANSPRLALDLDLDLEQEICAEEAAHAGSFAAEQLDPAALPREQLAALPVLSDDVESEARHAVGRWGEQYVYEWLKTRLPSDQKVLWMNEAEESGKCYDLHVQKDDGSIVTFIEASDAPSHRRVCFRF
eukprot:gene932-1448_t